MMVGGAILAVPFAGARAWTDYARLDLAGWGAVLFLGIDCSGLGFAALPGAAGHAGGGGGPAETSRCARPR
jgi:hypothetical protein